MKKKMITFAVLLLLGAGSIAAGIIGHIPKSTYRSVTGALQTGNKITITADPYEFWTDDEDYVIEGTCLYVTGDDDNETALAVIMSDNMHGALKRYLEEDRIVVHGIVEDCSEQDASDVYDSLIGYCEFLSTITNGYIVDENIEAVCRESISPYAINVTSIEVAPTHTLKNIAFTAGCILILSSLIVLISALSQKSLLRVTAVAVAVITLIAAAVAIVFRNEIRLMRSIRKDDEGIYYMEYDDELMYDELLAAGITSDQELISWYSEIKFHHLPINISPGRYGCSSFAAQTPEGDIIFGRNFDYGETDTLLIYSDPENGYASYAMADLYVLGIGDNDIDPDSPLGRLMMLAAPYVACDGVNEAGLGVSTLELDIGEIHQDTGRPDLFIYNAIRLLLDRCATVDEAIELLSDYDIHSHEDVRQHLFIVDSTGRSVVVEWFDDQMYVNEVSACTNSVITPGDHYDEGADSRLPTINGVLDDQGGILTPDEARDLLQEVRMGSMTEWSCVYYLNDFGVDLYADEDYSAPFRYGI